MPGQNPQGPVRNVAFVAAGTDGHNPQGPVDKMVIVDASGLTQLIIKKVDNITSLRDLSPLHTSVVSLLGYYSAGDGGGGEFAWADGNYTARLAVDTLGGVYVKANSVPASSGAWVRIDSDVLKTIWFGALNDGTDQSAVLQVALNVLAARGVDVGGIVTNNRGAAFNFKNIVLPKRSNIHYWRGDNKTPNNLATYTTNEYVMSIANANDDGVVNEAEDSGEYHVGRFVSLNNHTGSHDSYLGVVQKRVPTINDSVKASTGFHHSGWGAVTNLYQTFGGPSQYNCYQKTTSTRLVTLNGINISSFSPAIVASTTPASNLTVIRGTTSGAFGFANLIDGTKLVLFWQHGVFVVGETVKVVTNIGAGEAVTQTTTDVITSISYAQPINNSIFVGLNNGATGFGIPADFARLPFVFGGAFGVQRYVTYGQMSPYSDTTKVRFYYSDDFNLPQASRSGVYSQWNLSVSAASRRLTFHKDSNDAEIGLAYGPTANVNISDNGTTAGVVVGSYGLTFARNVGGWYDATFVDHLGAARTLQSTNYSVIYVSDVGSLRGLANIKTTTGFRIYLYPFDSAVAQLPATHTASIIVFGGDI